MDRDRIPSVGSIVWTCAPDSESESHGDRTPQEPWQVKVKAIKDAAAPRPLVIACGFNPETGELDDDSNATIYACLDRVHATEADALAEYVGAMVKWSEELRREADRASDAARSARRKLAEILGQG